MFPSRSAIRCIPAAALVVALSGATPSLGAPPVKRLLQDADLAETLYVRGPDFSSASPNRASMHLLDDLDGDGVREVLLTHLENGQETRFDPFVARIRSLRTGQVFATLAPLTQRDPVLLPLRNAHQAAVLVGDLNGDGVRDLVASRVSSSSPVLQVSSGVDGAELNRFGGSSTWTSGISILPEHGADAPDELLLGRTFAPFATAPLRRWSLADNTFAPVAPEGLDTTNSTISGYTMLDLGLDSKGQRRIHFTHYRSGSGAYFATELLGSEPLARIGGEFSAAGGELGAIHAGAAILGDLNADGVDEIVVTGQIVVDDTFGNPLPMRALPVLDGATGAWIGRHHPTASFPGATLILPNSALAPLGDITGDGFNDYAVVAEVRFPSFISSDAVLVQCGRTGQTILALTTDSIDPVEQITTSTPRNSSAGDWAARSHSLVSPGDLNGDGVNDLVVMMTSADPFEPPISLYLVTHYMPTPCAGDTNFDRAVNFADLNAVLSAFGANDITSPADLNADGVVNFADLNLVLSAFGQSCD
ncbi:MAG: hypothetical protein KF684_11740 [Phycisphaeraceae bacterium]|nr:hypothetical protein [Phycisphaeraceae bacterium]